MQIKKISGNRNRMVWALKTQNCGTRTWIQNVEIRSQVPLNYRDFRETDLTFCSDNDFLDAFQWSDLSGWCLKPSIQNWDYEWKIQTLDSQIESWIFTNTMNTPVEGSSIFFSFFFLMQSCCKYCSKSDDDFQQIRNEWTLKLLKIL